jgi:hypothetical protein
MTAIREGGDEQEQPGILHLADIRTCIMAIDMLVEHVSF